MHNTCNLRIMAAMLVISIAGCGGPGTPPPASNPNAVPAQAVNDTAIGAIRVRLSKATNGTEPAAGSFAAWLLARGIKDQDAAYLVSQFRLLGVTTILAIVPGDERFLSDAGFYVGGSPEIKATDLEDVLIKSTGLVGAALTVVDIGNGWFYIGINGDGVIEGASRRDAEALANLLDRVGDRPFIAVISMERIGFAANRARDRIEATGRQVAKDLGAEGLLQEGGFLGDDSATPADSPAKGLGELRWLAPSGNSRLAKRLSAFLHAGRNADAICWSVNGNGDAELLLVFPDEAHSMAFIASVDAIKRDLELAIQGQAERGKLTAMEADQARSRLQALRFDRQGAAVSLLETGN